jgi:hypothetical protein
MDKTKKITLPAGLRLLAIFGVEDDPVNCLVERVGKSGLHLIDVDGTHLRPVKRDLVESALATTRNVTFVDLAGLAKLELVQPVFLPTRLIEQLERGDKETGAGAGASNIVAWLVKTALDESDDEDDDA